MRTARVIQAIDWRQAVSELVLIVAGILIALAISDWNDRRIERKQELALLGEVRSALTTDLQILQENLTLTLEGAARIEQLIQIMEAGSPYSTEMDELFGAVYGIRSANLHTTAYETLKSVGLQQITNPALRLRVARVYDYHYERILGGHEVDLSVNFDLMRPYYLEHFSDLQFLRSATPIDYPTIISDTWYRNMVDYRLAVLRSNQLNVYPEAMAEMRMVLALLEEELETPVGAEQGP